MEQNEKLKQIALKILNKSTVQPSDYGFAMITILMIISIMLTCVRILQECNKSKTSSNMLSMDKAAIYGEQIKSLSAKKGWFTQLRIKRVLRKEMDPEDYAKYSMSIISALLDIGENLTEDEIITLVEAANV